MPMPMPRHYFHSGEFPHLICLFILAHDYDDIAPIFHYSARLRLRRYSYAYFVRDAEAVSPRQRCHLPCLLAAPDAHDADARQRRDVDDTPHARHERYFRAEAPTLGMPCFFRAKTPCPTPRPATPDAERLPFTSFFSMPFSRHVLPTCRCHYSPTIPLKSDRFSRALFIIDINFSSSSLFYHCLFIFATPLRHIFPPSSSPFHIRRCRCHRWFTPSPFMPSPMPPFEPGYPHFSCCFVGFSSAIPRMPVAEDIAMSSLCRHLCFRLFFHAIHISPVRRERDVFHSPFFHGSFIVATYYFLTILQLPA